MTAFRRPHTGAVLRRRLDDHRIRDESVLAGDGADKDESQDCPHESKADDLREFPVANGHEISQERKPPTKVTRRWPDGCVVTAD